MATGIAIAATLASAAVSAVGAVQQGRAQARSDDFNAAVARNNAIAAQQNALAARQQAALEAQRTRRGTVRALGAQTAAFAKSGVQITGSAQDIMFDSAIEGEMDALLQLYRGDIGARQERQTASDLRNQESQFRQSASAARTGAGIRAGASILGGASQAAGIKIRSDLVAKNR